jgi:hypothetical protein
MEPFIYFIKYLIIIKLKFGLIAIHNNEAVVICALHNMEYNKNMY